MNRQISKRLDRLEAKARKRQPRVLNTMAAIEEADRRWHSLGHRKGGLSDAEKAEYARLQKLLEPVIAATTRMTELLVREVEGTPLTPEEAAELAELKRWCPPDPLLESHKAIAVALKKSGATRTHGNLEDFLR